MKRIPKVFLALGVLAGGTGLALLFRLEEQQTTTAASAKYPTVVSQQPDLSADTGQGGSAPTVRLKESSDRVTAPPAVTSRQDPRPDSAKRSGTPPQFAESRSRAERSSIATRGRDGLGGLTQAKAAPQPARSHKIVDGDSLTEIARVYLGSASLAGEIFEANRAKLSDPALLPIGVELTIPARVPRTNTAPSSPIRRPLVPIAPGDRPLPESHGPRPARQAWVTP